MSRLAFLLCFFFSACTPSSSEILFIVPVGYRGLFLIREDQDEQKQPETDEGVTVLKIPDDGILFVRDMRPLRNWHKSKAEWENGKKLPIALSADDKFGLRYLTTDSHGNTLFLVGDRNDEIEFYKNNDVEALLRRVEKKRKERRKADW